MAETLADARKKIERNKRVQARYDQLIAEGRHGHYETMFRVVREEVERDRAPLIAERDVLRERLQAALRHTSSAPSPNQAESCRQRT